jgi:hypothetical protein
MLTLETSSSLAFLMDALFSGAVGIEVKTPRLGRMCGFESFCCLCILHCTAVRVRRVPGLRREVTGEPECEIVDAQDAIIIQRYRKMLHHLASMYVAGGSCDHLGRSYWNFEECWVLDLRDEHFL